MTDGAIKEHRATLCWMLDIDPQEIRLSAFKLVVEDIIREHEQTRQNEVKHER